MTNTERQIWIAAYGAACAGGRAEDSEMLAFLAVMRLRWNIGNGCPISPYSEEGRALADAMADEVLGTSDQGDDEPRCPKCGGEVRKAGAIRDMGGPGIECVKCKAKSPRITQEAATMAIINACMRAWKE
ncbi:MAG: hypothetical protein GTN71_05765 [Anaerolineae bacterium]|nr:hypothetical protein [Anaerolineae bacterium]